MLTEQALVTLWVQSLGTGVDVGRDAKKQIGARDEENPSSG